MGEAPERIVLVETEDDVERARGRRPRPGRLHHPDDALGRRDRRRSSHAPARALPEDRRAAHRRHLLRHDQPPDGRQADGPRLRPGARDRLDQLVELEPPRRGRARPRRRLAPDRQRRRRCARSGWRASAWSASPPAPAPRRSLSSDLSSSSASAASSDSLRVRRGPRGRALHAAEGDSARARSTRVAHRTRRSFCEFAHPSCRRDRLPASRPPHWEEEI